MRLALAIAVLLVLAARADAHVSPSMGENNRFLKVTPLGDRIRLAYTIMYGQMPGAVLRRTIDTSRDGAIDSRESEAFGARIAGELAGALEVTVDGKPQPVAWAQVVVGLGTPETVAGTFSIDLIAWFCLPAPRGTHTLLLRDRYPLDRPGETEVKVEDSPGIKVDRARIGDDDELGDSYKILGPGGPLQDHGLDVQFTAGAQSIITSDAICEKPAPPRTLPTRAIVGSAVAVAVVLVGAVALLRRRRQRSRPRPSRR
jgi:hypothetical protein